MVMGLSVAIAIFIWNQPKLFAAQLTVDQAVAIALKRTQMSPQRRMN